MDDEGTRAHTTRKKKGKSLSGGIHERLTQVLAQPDLRGNRPPQRIVVQHQHLQLLQVSDLGPDGSRESKLRLGGAPVLVAVHGVLEPQLLELAYGVEGVGDCAGHFVLVEAQVLEVLHVADGGGDVKVEFVLVEVDLAEFFEAGHSLGEVRVDEVVLGTEENCGVRKCRGGEAERGKPLANAPREDNSMQKKLREIEGAHKC